MNVGWTIALILSDTLFAVYLDRSTSLTSCWLKKVPDYGSSWWWFAVSHVSCSPSIIGHLSMLHNRLGRTTLGIRYACSKIIGQSRAHAWERIKSDLWLQWYSCSSLRLHTWLYIWSLILSTIPQNNTE
jgi:hypothetical protein